MTSQTGRLEELPRDSRNQPIMIVANADFQVPLGYDSDNEVTGTLDEVNVTSLSLTNNRIYSLWLWEGAAATGDLLVHFTINSTATDPVDTDPVLPVNDRNAAGNAGRPFVFRAPSSGTNTIRFYNPGWSTAGTILYNLTPRV